MFWLKDNTLTWGQQLCIRLLRCGATPQHIAFIMDGNRRYAKKNNVTKLDGHSKGFDTMSRTLGWCLDLGIKEVTVYAFSIENFKRNEQEVTDLLNLTREKFKSLLEEKDKLMENGVKIQVIGNLSLLPADLAKLFTEAELLTKNNDKAILNVAFAYTARDEITEGIKKIVQGYQSSLIDMNDINMQLLSHCLYTRDSPFPDLSIRTSGEKRLSDFLLFQSAYSYLYFTDVLWPDFTAWHLLSAVFQYQRAYPQLVKIRESIPKRVFSERANKFLEANDENRWKSAAVTLSA